MVARSWAERLMQEIYEKDGYDVISVGAPDFILLKGNRIEFVEIKTKYDQPSKDQKRAIRLLKEHGFNARTEKIKCYKNNQRPGYHTIRILQETSCDQTLHRLSEGVKKLIGDKNRY